MKSKGLRTVMFMCAVVLMCPLLAYAFSMMYVPAVVTPPMPTAIEFPVVHVWEDLEPMIDRHENSIEAIMRDARLKRTVIRSAA